MRTARLLATLLFYSSTHSAVAESFHLNDVGREFIAEHITQAFQPEGQEITFAEESSQQDITFIYQADQEEVTVTVKRRIPALYLYGGKDTGIRLYEATMGSDEALLQIDSQSMQLSRFQDTSSGPRTFHTVLDDNQVNGFFLDEGGTSLLPENPLEALTEDITPDIASIQLADQQPPPLTVHLFKNWGIRTWYSGLMILHLNNWVKHMDDINHDHKKKGRPALFSHIIMDFAPPGTIPMQSRVYHWHTVYSKKEDKIKAMLDEFERDLKPWYASRTHKHPPSHTKFLYFESVLVHHSNLIVG